MNAQDNSGSEQNTQPAVQLNRHLLAQGTEKIQPFFDSLAALRESVLGYADSADQTVNKRLRTLARKIDSFEGSVTLIGQVKAGKTALTNVLSGNIGLLPSDVNPWTSVVTSVHINSRTANAKTRSQFKFFERDEWDKLIKGGGRLGELAGRAGAHDDLDTLRRQIDEMRDAARQRLSKNFEALLGKIHKYGYVDRELIERYVCLGDPDDLELNPKSQQGRFSDITKSAGIWLDVPELAGSYLLRDTPGVNDTFMVREQITIRALRGSKICVVVLSAHEALNTTDLALVRLISNFEHRQLVLFVNRIDELDRPSEQVPEILQSIRATLESQKQKNLHRDICVLFGSARWAEMALTGDYSGLDEDSAASLEDWARNGGFAAEKDRDSLVWKLSGVPHLMSAINERIVAESGKRHIATIRAALKGLANEIAAREQMAAETHAAQRFAQINATTLRGELAKTSRALVADLQRTLDRLSDDFGKDLRLVQDEFVGRATDALVEQLEKNDGEETWTFNSAGLRLVLRTTYDRFFLKAKGEVEAVYRDAALAFGRVYSDTFGLEIDGFAIEPPQMPKAPPPVALGKTIAIDLGSTWWNRWWQRRRNLKNHAKDYSVLIEAEIASIIHDLHSGQIPEVFDDLKRILTEFNAEQTESILDLLKSAADAKGLFDQAEPRTGGLSAFLQNIVEVLDEIEPEDFPLDAEEIELPPARMSMGGN